ncbi:primosomal protein N' [Aliidiomarina sedimenti]|uniref:Replication restart protein PriA n=1 Tax=Aliidiomarina sedimenti TaxID=1933879 RepID=A0ABY0BY49_9GAMM|nr:primosomal protein N' [Aliidiomarina sedimenti]RUO29192.1 primosomal protein N' [Aliidiomarina sedimenti]
MTIIRIALPVPMMRLFDYQIDSALLAGVKPGARVKVPFASRQLIGFVVALDVTPDIAVEKLKAVTAVLEQESLFPAAMWKLLQFAASYYHHPLGEVLTHAAPAALRQGEAASYQTVRRFRLSHEGEQVSLDDFKRAAQQQRLLAALREKPLSATDIRRQDFSASALKALQNKGLIVAEEHAPDLTGWRFAAGEDALTLNQEQAVAVAALTQSISAREAHVWLLEGVTGSGKTEVYLQAMQKVLERGEQILVLVPEIGLTPQTVRRFEQRFNVPVVALHSGLTDNERLQGWLQARDNEAAIIIGTRSAIFTPCKALGMIILDEEHDSSFKQQDGFRYNARDLAVKRAHDAKVNLILGSATPSLESLANALAGKYRHLQLKQRAGNAQMARHALIDLKQERLQHGLSESLLARMEQHLKAGNQVLLFLNRRGFASALLCHECGWVGECARCQRPFTVHQQAHKLQCHHCGAERAIPRQCHSCGSPQLITQGLGTEQLESALQERLPDYPVLRIDRDSTRRKGQLAAHLDAAASGEYPILIGTQMLAKGHHFPDVTLVALLDVDGALYSNDFRAAERLGQLYTQVAGRAGRASKPGVVVLQTHHPEHPLVQELVNNGYHDFARSALSERQLALLPPAASMALIRAEATQEMDAQNLLQAMSQVLQAAMQQKTPQVHVLGPMPAPMPRRAGRFRYQLLLHAAQRKDLHALLQQARGTLETLPQTRKARWSLDIDPQDFT